MRTNNIQRSLLSMPGLKFVFTFVLLIALANTSTAYSIVFRDGHKVEVPSDFTVTAATLTYEAAPGINRTVQVLLIDVAATERANHEAPGSFFKHAEKNIASSLPQSRHAQRTLTNRDLEPIRQRRIESEQNYEKRRVELGLPSLEETRRRQAVEEEATLDLARRRAAAEANDEAYWRSRAAALRNEIVSVDAEINYVRGQLGSSRPGSFITQGFGSSASLFGGFGRRSEFAPPGAGRWGTQAVRNTRSQGLTNMGEVALRPQRSLGGFSFRRGFGFGSFVPGFTNGYVDTSDDLNLRLNDLLQTRAGLEAQWRELENGARIARAPQVWLAP